MKKNKESKKQELIINLLEKSFGDTIIITDKSGIGLKNKKFYEAAAASVKNGKDKKDHHYFWHPLLWKSKAFGACGLKIDRAGNKEEIKMIDGLMGEIDYESFLEDQVDRNLDPKSNFIKELLCSENIKSFDQAIDRADIIGLNLRSPQAIIVIKIPGLFKKFHEKCKKYPKNLTSVYIDKECNQLIGDLKRGFDNYEQNIFTCLEPDMFVCLKWARGQISTLNTINFYRKKGEYISEIIEKKIGIKPTIGVGQYYPGLNGLRKSFSDAQIALSLGEKVWGPKRVYHITDVGLFVALSAKTSFDRKCELAHQILGPIFDDKSLYKTITTFLECDMSLTEAAKKLHLHRNTLIYRLEKIKKETGLDPKKFSDAIQIKLGLMLYGPTLVKN